MSARFRRGKQQQLWAPDELPPTHRFCNTCESYYSLESGAGCTWCSSGLHARAEARIFANRWLIAQFPEKARTMPRASYAYF